jgi:hypothetical protein
MIQQLDARIRARFAAASVLAFVVVVGLGCASAGVTTTDKVADSSVVQPGVVLVYDFAVMPGDVVVDTFGSEFESEGKELSKDEKEAYATANVLSEKLVAYLQERGIPGERANSATRPPLNAILIKGQFVTIDAGSRIKRMVIGFGAGSSELRAMVQVYQATQQGLRRLASAEAEASGSKMPGMAVPVVGGAAAGSVATSAVISGGMAIARETKGAMAPDAGRMAKKIAERAEDFYKRQGWL